MWILPRITQNRLDSDSLLPLIIELQKKIQFLKVMSKLYMVAHAYNPRI